MRTPSFPQAIPVDPATVPADQRRYLPSDQRPAEPPRFHTTPAGHRYRVVPVTVSIELNGLIPTDGGTFPSVVDEDGDVRFLNPAGHVDWLSVPEDAIDYTVEYRRG